MKKYFRLQTKDGQGIFTGLGNLVYPCDDTEFKKLAVNKALCDLELQLSKAPKAAQNNTNSAYTEKEFKRLKSLGFIDKLLNSAKAFGKPVEIVKVHPTNILYEDDKQVVYSLEKIR